MKVNESALTGKGLQVDNQPQRSLSVYVPPKGGMMIPYRTPPCLGSWENPIGMGVKKRDEKKRKRDPIRQRFSILKYPNSRGNPIKFINKPLSNIDLSNWITKLKIKYFRGIFSRDKLPNKINKECGIINLDSQKGPGTHRVCYRNLDDKYCEYFDPFDLNMPKEIEFYLSTSGKQIVYSGDEIQERESFCVDIGVCII